MSGHDYLSTGCLHGDMVLPDGRTGHEYCQGDTGAAGAKMPAQCKFCGAKCTCPCHMASIKVGRLMPGCWEAWCLQCFPVTGGFLGQVATWERAMLRAGEHVREVHGG